MNRILWLALFLVACQPKGPEKEAGKMQIVCTTGMIADAVAQIAGEQAEVKSLMGPGVDPHLYKATQGDLHLLGQADLIFYNGLHLEGKMGEVLEKIGRSKPVTAVSGGIASDRLLSMSEIAEVYDPHIWFDLGMWADVVSHIGSVMAAQDSLHAEAYRVRAAAYRDSLLQLDEWVRRGIGEIPEQQRVLVTAHDAFSYFGRAYEIEVRGLQGISTVSEYGLRDVTDLVDFLSSRRIPAVFVESSVPSKPLEAVVEGCAQKGHEVRIGGTLFSDAMGPAGTPEGTYMGMVRANVRTIVDGLKRQEDETSH